MALSVKLEGLKHVPWFSLSEWHQVYKQVYSNDNAEQTKGYERLLVWKARIPKLPVGVECTLSIIQVCLRDRDLTPKIDRAELPVYYENDLCLMYSTTIMRFLNHISNIGHTKQSSLFQIAKQLKIPEWIVNLRHDAAHGHELPSIDVLRMAANILLEWLHEEYWAAEAKAMEEHLAKQAECMDEEEPEEVQALTDLIELWMTIGLYIHAGYSSVKEIPDKQLRQTLLDLRTFTLNSERSQGEDNESDVDEWTSYELKLQSDKNYKLITAQAVLLSEISRYLSKNKTMPNMDEVALNVLFDGDAFLPNEEFLEIFKKKKTTLEDLKEDCLPSGMIQFWQEFILLLHQRNVLEKLVLRLLKIVNDELENEHKRFMASLWMKCIVHGLCKIKVAQRIRRRLEREQKDKKKMSLKLLSLKIRDEINCNYPEFKDVLWLHVLGEIPNCLIDMNFITETLLIANKFSMKFISYLLELVRPTISVEIKQKFLRLIRAYLGDENYLGANEDTDEDKVYTVEDITRLCGNQNGEPESTGCYPGVDAQTIKVTAEIGDRTIRNTSWTLAPVHYDWGACPIGILPWQMESMDSVDSFVTTASRFTGAPKDIEVVPGIVDSKSLTMRSKINWESVLGRKKKTKRKRQKGSVDSMVDRAMKAVRQQQ